jgi:Arc/MetJ-type ribon-helix-helix transcriptional regulator
MPVFVCRNRVLSVRLSEEEYDTLMERSVREGARSLSDFVRAAVLEPASENGRVSQALEAKVADLDGLNRRLEELDRKVGHISRKLD